MSTKFILLKKKWKSDDSEPDLPIVIHDRHGATSLACVSKLIYIYKRNGSIFLSLSIYLNNCEKKSWIWHLINNTKTKVFYLPSALACCRTTFRSDAIWGFCRRWDQFIFSFNGQKQYSWHFYQTNVICWRVIKIIRRLRGIYFEPVLRYKLLFKNKQTNIMIKGILMELPLYFYTLL